MPQFTLLKAAPYLVIAALLALLGFTANQYLKERDELVALQAKVKVLGEEAEQRVKDAIEKDKQILDKVKEDYEGQVPRVRSEAVANYIATHPQRVRGDVACGRTVPAPTNSNPLDDGTVEESVPDQTGLEQPGIEVEESFIQECGVDALKLDTWQQWCKAHDCRAVD